MAFAFLLEICCAVIAIKWMNSMLRIPAIASVRAVLLK